MPLTRPPSLNAIRAFEAAARLGSLTRAAEALHVTHGAISRQIRLLEDTLGTALFARAGRGLRLTAAGLQLRDAAGEAFARLDGAVAAIRRAGQERPRLLGCPGSLLARWMIPRLPALNADLPALDLHLSAREGAFPDALEGFDAVLMIGSAPWPPGWRVRPLAREWIGPVLSPRHPEAARLSALSPLQLLHEPLLHTGSRPQAWPEWAAAHGEAPPARPGAGFAHLYYLLEAAVAGLGVAIAPRELVATDLDEGRLIAPWGFVGTDAHWVLATPRDCSDPEIEALGNWLAHALAPVSG